MARFVKPDSAGGRGSPIGGGWIEVRDTVGKLLFSQDVDATRRFLFGPMVGWNDILAVVDPVGDRTGVVLLKVRHTEPIERTDTVNTVETRFQRSH